MRRTLISRNVPDNSTSGASAIEKQKSDLLDFYVAVRSYSLLKLRIFYLLD